MIALRAITKTFHDGSQEVQVLRGVDLEAAPGELVAIVGQSGSGKSTLLYVAGALDGDFGGEAIVAGRSLRAMSERDRAELRNRRIGFVFQSFNLLPGLSALENVMLPGVLRRGGEPFEGLRERARAALARVGMGDKATARPARLSGGERQRVAIARALAAGPALLLADEPTGNLDATTGEGIIRLFRELAAGGLTVLVVTHEERVSRAAERVLHLQDGRLS
ncbi:MAG TPA: ABC transporter ATP-binding protein [Anaeromyxobacteraceae bacterium]|nr:ABC transporter ATP-binding protein [Anaeromyxobacteraceae bacterium]